MGIKNLTKFLSDAAPLSIKEYPIAHYAGRKVAIDASMCLYQFLFSVRSIGENLTNSEGEVTSHLSGLFYRTLRLLESGVKVVYVFDGKPPDIKSYELDKRVVRRDEAQLQLDKAREDGDSDRVDMFEKRLIKVTPQHNDEAKQLLRLMGIPVVEAPTEAEAQCAALVATNKVFATATEDMDALTFGSSILLRNLTASASKDLNIQQFDLGIALQQLDVSMDMFVDICILLGCDYCETIPGIGPKRALALIKELKTIETILDNLDLSKLNFDRNNWNYKAARAFFKSPEVLPAGDIDLKWTLPDEQGLIDFMVTKHGFQQDRITKGIDRIKKTLAVKQQGRLDSFFTLVKQTPPPNPVKPTKPAPKRLKRN